MADLVRIFSQPPIKKANVYLFNVCNTSKHWRPIVLLNALSDLELVEKIEKTLSHFWHPKNPDPSYGNTRPSQ